MVDVGAVAVVGPSRLLRPLVGTGGLGRHGLGSSVLCGSAGGRCGRRTSLPDARDALAPPGRSTGPCPCQRVSSASTARQVDGLAGRARRRRAASRGAPGVRSAAGSAAGRRGAASAAVGAQARQLGGGQPSRASRSSRSSVRRAGQRGGDPAAEHVLQQRQHLGAQPGPGVRGVGVPRVVPHRQPLRRRRPAGSVARRTPSSGRHQARRRRPGVDHAGHRARPRPAAEAEQHGLGLVVEGVPERDPAAPSCAAAGRARRTGPSRAAASGPPSAADRRPQHDATGSRPSPRSSVGGARGPLGRARLQAVVDGDRAGRAPRPAAPRRPPPRRARGSRRRRCRRRAPAGRARPGPGRTARRSRATAGVGPATALRDRLRRGWRGGRARARPSAPGR